MRFILFFYLLSLTVIIGFVLAEDTVVDSDFYQEYLAAKEISTALQEEPIRRTDIPSKVMKSFAESPFNDKVISQAYKIPASTASNLISALIDNAEKSEETYVLALAGENERMYRLRYNRHGELINVVQ